MAGQSTVLAASYGAIENAKEYRRQSTRHNHLGDMREESNVGKLDANSG